MKLIPYTSLSASIPAMFLVAANATTMLGPSIQIASILALILVLLPHLKVDLRGSWLLIIYVAVCLVIGFHRYGADQAVIKAGKLVLFCVASTLSVRGFSQDQGFSALVALRCFFVLCTLNFGFAAMTGDDIFRADHFIEFSIYSSYSIALLVYLARPYLTPGDRVLAWAFSLLCGSTTGLLVLILAEIVGRRWRPRTVFAVLVFAPLGLAALQFLMEVREKDLSLEFLLTSDRARLLTTFSETTLRTFTLSNWAFGLGPGKPLHEFISSDEGFDGYLKRLGEGAVYAFCLHNEPLRILCDFGLVGLFLVGLRLWTNCPGPFLVLLGICLMTNSYLYSFSGALIASSLFLPKPKGRSLRARTYPEPLEPAPEPLPERPQFSHARP